MKVLTVQKGFTRVALAFIVGAALVLTYDGTMKFAQAHGAHGWRGAVIAAMNDLAVLVGILWPARPLQGIAVLCSGLTVWANVDHAGQGPGGLTVALVPPVLAILMVSALEYLVRHPVREPVVSQPEPVAAHEPISEPVDEPPVSREPTHEPPREPVSRTSEPTWDRESVLRLIAEEGLSTAEAVIRTGTSKATINRWKREAA